MHEKRNRNHIIILFGIACILRIVLAPLVWHPDVRNHVDWGERFWEYGANNFYQANVWDYTWPNQPPGTIYLFAFSRMLFEGLWSVLWYLNTTIPVFPSTIISYFELNLYPAVVKLPAILADLGIAWLIIKFLVGLGYNKKKFSIFNFQFSIPSLAAALFLFNPVIWYNSAVWGQYDAVINFLVLFSFYHLLKKRLTLAFILFALSLYIKLSLAIFLPIFAIVAIFQKYSFLQYVKSCVLSIFLIGIITIPFSNSEPFTWLYYLYKDKVLTQQLHVITANAFNFWGALTGLEEVPNTGKFAGLTIGTWGGILFALTYIPILFMVYKKHDMKTVIIALALTAFSSFMLLTNMHERYLYPLFAPFTILAVVNRQILLYVIISLISFLNMYNLWWVPRIERVIDLFTMNEKIVPRIFSVILTMLFFVYYWKGINYGRRSR